MHAYGTLSIQDQETMHMHITLYFWSIREDIMQNNGKQLYCTQSIIIIVCVELTLSMQKLM